MVTGSVDELRNWQASHGLKQLATAEPRIKQARRCGRSSTHRKRPTCQHRGSLNESSCGSREARHHDLRRPSCLDQGPQPQFTGEAM